MLSFHAFSLPFWQYLKGTGFDEHQHVSSKMKLYFSSVIFQQGSAQFTVPELKVIVQNKFSDDRMIKQLLNSVFEKYNLVPRAIPQRRKEKPWERGCEKYRDQSRSQSPQAPRSAV